MGPERDPNLETHPTAAVPPLSLASPPPLMGASSDRMAAPAGGTPDADLLESVAREVDREANADQLAHRLVNVSVDRDGWKDAAEVTKAKVELVSGILEELRGQLHADVYAKIQAALRVDTTPVLTGQMNTESLFQPIKAMPVATPSRTHVEDLEAQRSVAFKALSELSVTGLSKPGSSAGVLAARVRGIAYSAVIKMNEVALIPDDSLDLPNLKVQRSKALAEVDGSTGRKSHPDLVTPPLFDTPVDFAYLRSMLRDDVISESHDAAQTMLDNLETVYRGGDPSVNNHNIMVVGEAETKLLQAQNLVVKAQGFLGYLPDEVRDAMKEANGLLQEGLYSVRLVDCRVQA